ncbi:MFS transporter [Streptomyces sp. NBC_00963]|uniref:MFS transporter n=1 Tax=Streptomyces sp. NBC_00963 TaxID=2903697 RepID=UPI003866EDBD|nr:MFS transporter [Streptomyces sp. NBC_00963]
MADIATKYTGGPTKRGRLHPAWPVAAVAALAIVAAGAFTTMAGLFTEPLHREFGWSHGEIGLAASVNMVVYGAVAPFSAALMDRFGMRRVVGAALAAVAVGALLSTAMSAPWQYVLTWGLLIGLGSGAMALTFAATVTQRWFVRRRGLVSGVLTAAGVFGQFVFLPVLSWVVDGHGWRTAAVLPALVACAALPLALVLLRDHPADAGVRAYGAQRFTPKPAALPGAAARTVRVLGAVARGAPFWLLAATFAICGASTNGVMWTHFTPAAHDHGMPATAASSLLALIGVFNVAGTVLSGWLTDRLDPRRLLAVYYALRGVTLLCLPVLMSATVQPPMVAFVVLFGLLDVATVPPTLALCRELYGADSAIVFGWVAAAHQLGAGLAAFLGGVARDAFGSYDPLWVAIGAVCGAGALLALVIARPAGRCGTVAGPEFG